MASIEYGPEVPESQESGGKLMTQTKVRIAVRKILMVLAIVFTMFGQAWAMDLFVAPNGSDSVPRANNDINHPWLTPARAWNQAVAGDIVYFRAGTYIISSQVTAANNGTVGSPITFKNYTGESVTFDSTGSSIWPFLILKTYHVFDGFTIRSRATGIWFGGWYDGDASGGTVQNCTFVMTVGFTDNAGCIMAGPGTHYTSFTNNTITGPGATNANVAGIWVDRTRGAIIRNNEISGFPKCIYWKHSNTLANTGVDISYNYTTGCLRGISLTSNYANVSHNIIVYGVIDLADDGGAGDGGVGGDYNTIHHNTVLRTGVGEVNASIHLIDQGDPAYGNIIRDNVLTTNLMILPYSSASHATTMDYNLYIAGNIVLNNRINYTLATWRTFYGQDAHSLSGAPTFVGGVTPSTIAGYGLTPGSIGHNAASDGTDMGADISRVGRNAGISPPLPPFGLRVY